MTGRRNRGPRYHGRVRTWANNKATLRRMARAYHVAPLNPMSVSPIQTSSYGDWLRQVRNEWRDIHIIQWPDGSEDAVYETPARVVGEIRRVVKLDQRHMPRSVPWRTHETIQDVIQMPGYWYVGHWDRRALQGWGRGAYYTNTMRDWASDVPTWCITGHPSTVVPKGTYAR